MNHLDDQGDLAPFGDSYDHGDIAAGSGVSWSAAAVVAMIGWLIVALTLGVLIGHARAETGVASVYSTREGTRTASGIPLRDGALTAAHKSLPLRSCVRVLNQRNGRVVNVTITDRGPYVRGRIIDLTPASAQAIACHDLCHVTVGRC